jgi:hypothetical protein
MRELNGTMDSIAVELTPELSNLAVEAGWPDRVAASLSVVNRDGGLIAETPGFERQAEDLEFGTAGRPPRSVMANFFLDKEVQRRIQDSTNDQVGAIISRRLGGFFR